MTEVTLVELVTELDRAKRDELEAKAKRIILELKVIEMTGFAKAEGSESFEDQQNGFYTKIGIKQPVTRNVSADGWLKVRRDLPNRSPWKKIMRPKFELDAKIAKQCRENDPDAWAKISACVTTKNGKPSVEIKSLTKS